MHEREQVLIEPLVIVVWSSRLAFNLIGQKHSHVTSEKPYLILEFKMCLSATHRQLKSQETNTKQADLSVTDGGCLRRTSQRWMDQNIDFLKD